jgi:hypothetical protein
MSVKVRYPKELLNILNLSSNTIISEKKIFDIIISKCQKQYGAKYKMPKNIFTVICNENWLLNQANSSTNNYMYVRTSEVKRWLKKIASENIDDSQYVTLTSTYNNIPIRQLEVTI